MPESKRIYEIDGARFSNLDEFAAEFSRVVLNDYEWKGSLDAFNDILRGGFGTPDGGFILRWKNSALSRERLGYTETVRILERRLKTSLSINREYVIAELERARSRTGTTVFDWLIEIIQEHCAGGAEQEDGVELLLE